jgi:hypothetical protein
MTPGSGFTHRGARIVPIARVYQKGPTPTDSGVEIDEPGSVPAGLVPQAPASSDANARIEANASVRMP